mmetsp:Transcript_17872/g.62701  ORF Transcript_17872/g.62701 Transcript_17872/m.62701 type:complete len:200 (-) Transcript_17872:1161-1760(-)
MRATLRGVKSIKAEHEESRFLSQAVVTTLPSICTSMPRGTARSQRTLYSGGAASASTPPCRCWPAGWRVAKGRSVASTQLPTCMQCPACNGCPCAPPDHEQRGQMVGRRRTTAGRPGERSREREGASSWRRWTRATLATMEACRRRDCKMLHPPRHPAPRRPSSKVDPHALLGHPPRHRRDPKEPASSQVSDRHGSHRK